jgi:hypothetical protein
MQEIDSEIDASVMLKSRTVIVLYWDCGNEKHNHRTRGVAERCKAKRLKAEAYARLVPNGRNGKPYSREYPFLVLRGYLEAGTFRQAAQQLNRSPERIRQLSAKAQRMMQRSIWWPLKNIASALPEGTEEESAAWDEVEKFERVFSDIKANRDEVFKYIDVAIRAIQAEEKA